MRESERKKERVSEREGEMEDGVRGKERERGST